MIQKGNTVVFKNDNGSLGFYWLCDIRPDGYVFFDWYGNPRRASASDFCKMSKEWFDSKVKDGTIEVYDFLPLDIYGDIFERQAQCRNATNV